MPPTPKPTLYLHGRGRRLHAAVLHRRRPLEFLAEGSELEVVDGTGHFLHVERPDVVNRRVVEFLAP